MPPEAKAAPSERRFLTSDEMNRIADACAYSDQAIARAVGEDSEMVEGGYEATLTRAQVGRLAEMGLLSTDG